MGQKFQLSCPCLVPLLMTSLNMHGQSALLRPGQDSPHSDPLRVMGMSQPRAWPLHQAPSSPTLEGPSQVVQAGSQGLHEPLLLGPPPKIRLLVWTPQRKDPQTGGCRGGGGGWPVPGPWAGVPTLLDHRDQHGTLKSHSTHRVNKG